tara:strand:+ start:194 stop:367 length:174 start_codon:yes stop_codon:yes gene_type:complete
MICLHCKTIVPVQAKGVKDRERDKVRKFKKENQRDQKDIMEIRERKFPNTTLVEGCI